MARIRTIKPEFWTSEQVLECSPIARLMFIGLWNFADDTGRHKVSARAIKAEIFPGDDMASENILRMIEELERNGLVQRYTIDDVEYLQITGWHHQRIDKPQPAKYPEPPRLLEDHSKNDPRTIPPDTIRNDTIREESIGRDSPTAPAAGPRPDELKLAVTAYNAMAERTGLPTVQKLNDQRKAKLRQRLKDAKGMDGWKAALAKVEASDFLCGRSGKGEWRASFDFLLQESSFVKLIEGQYDNHRPNGQPRAGPVNLDNLDDATERRRYLDSLKEDRIEEERRQRETYGA